MRCLSPVPNYVARIVGVPGLGAEQSGLTPRWRSIAQPAKRSERAGQRQQLAQLSRRDEPPRARPARAVAGKSRRVCNSSHRALRPSLLAALLKRRRVDRLECIRRRQWAAIRLAKMGSVEQARAERTADALAEREIDVPVVFFDHRLCGLGCLD